MARYSYTKKQTVKKSPLLLISNCDGSSKSYNGEIMNNPFLLVDIFEFGTVFQYFWDVHVYNNPHKDAIEEVFNTPYLFGLYLHINDMTSIKGVYRLVMSCFLLGLDTNDILKSVFFFSLWVEDEKKLYWNFSTSNKISILVYIWMFSAKVEIKNEILKIRSSPIFIYTENYSSLWKLMFSTSFYWIVREIPFIVTKFIYMNVSYLDGFCLFPVIVFFLIWWMIKLLTSIFCY